jgi:hypothetical protein
MRTAIGMTFDGVIATSVAKAEAKHVLPHASAHGRLDVAAEAPSPSLSSPGSGHKRSTSQQLWPFTNYKWLQLIVSMGFYIS